MRRAELGLITLIIKLLLSSKGTDCCEAGKRLREYNYLAYYFAIVIITRTMWLFGLTVNNRLGWSIAQLLLTSGQFVILFKVFASQKHLQILVCLSFPILFGLLSLTNSPWYNNLILVKSIQLFVMCCVFVCLEKDLLNISLSMYFITLWVSSLFSNSGILLKLTGLDWSTVNLYSSVILGLSNALTLIYFVQRRHHEKEEEKSRQEIIRELEKRGNIYSFASAKRKQSA